MSTPATAQDNQGVATKPSTNPRQAAKANIRQSLDFVKQVQTTYDPQSETYKEFLKILQEYFQAVRADSAPGEKDEQMVDALERIKKLFDGHNDLIQGLDNFWPDRYKKQD